MNFYEHRPRRDPSIAERYNDIEELRSCEHTNKGLRAHIETIRNAGDVAQRLALAKEENARLLEELAQVKKERGMPA